MKIHFHNTCGGCSDVDYLIIMKSYLARQYRYITSLLNSQMAEGQVYFKSQVILSNNLQ